MILASSAVEQQVAVAVSYVIDGQDDDASAGRGALCEQIGQAAAELGEDERCLFVSHVALSIRPFRKGERIKKKLEKQGDGSTPDRSRAERTLHWPTLLRRDAFFQSERPQGRKSQLSLPFTWPPRTPGDCVSHFFRNTGAEEANSASVPQLRRSHFEWAPAFLCALWCVFDFFPALIISRAPPPLALSPKAHLAACLREETARSHR